MSSYKDLFNPDRTQMDDLQSKQSSIVEEPKPSWWMTAKEAVAKPSQTSAYIAKIKDSMDGSMPLPIEQLKEKYPDAPPEMWDRPMTARQAEWAYDYNYHNNFLNFSKQQRNTGFFGNLGYGILEETSPASLGVGVVAGTAAAIAAPAIGAAAGMSALATAVTGVGLDAVLNTVGDIAMRKGSEDFTGIKTDDSAAAIATNVVFNVAISSGMKYALDPKFRALFGRSSNTAKKAMSDMFDEEMARRATKLVGTREPPLEGTVQPRQYSPPKGYLNKTKADFEAEFKVKTPLEGEVVRDVPVPRIDKAGKPDVPAEYGLPTIRQPRNMTAADDLGMHDRIKYRSYAYVDPELDGLVSPRGLYGVYAPESPTAHIGAEAPFGSGIYLSDDAHAVAGYSKAVQQSGLLYETSPEDFNLLKALESGADSQEFADIGVILRDLNIESKGATDVNDLLIALRNSDLADLGESLVQEYLVNNGFDGLQMSTAETIADSEFIRNHTFLFKSIDDTARSILKELDGTAGALPPPEYFGYGTKAWDLQHGEGILSNGKKITLDPQGFFHSDPIYGHPEMAKGLTNFFHESQFRMMDESIKANGLDKVMDKYTAITQSAAEYLKEQRDFNKVMSDNMDTPTFVKENPLEALIEQKFKDLAEEMKTKDPAILDEVAKALEACMRKF